MSDDQPNKPLPGGLRMPDHIRMMAIARTEDLMLQGYSPRDILNKLSEDGYTDSEHTAQKWRHEIQKRWAQEDAEVRPARKDAWRLRIETIYRELIENARTATSQLAKAAFYAESTKLTKLALLMDGLTAPVRVEHSGKVDVAALQPQERESEIAALLRKRDEARAAAKAAGKSAN